MTTLWRISNHIDLSGEGARLASGRWNTEGKPVVYLTENPAAAVLERIVHMIDLDWNEDGLLPRFYQLLRVQLPDDLSIKPLNALAPADWRENLQFTRSLGDAWLAARETPLARVPSAIAPQTWNYLLNPEHPEAKCVEVAEVVKERFDNRLFRSGAR